MCNPLKKCFRSESSVPHSINFSLRCTKRNPELWEAIKAFVLGSEAFIPLLFGASPIGHGLNPASVFPSFDSVLDILAFFEPQCICGSLLAFVDFETFLASRPTSTTSSILHPLPPSQSDTGHVATDKSQYVLAKTNHALPYNQGRTHDSFQNGRPGELMTGEWC